MARSLFTVVATGKAGSGFYAKLQRKSSHTVETEGLGESVSNTQLTYYVKLNTLNEGVEGKEIAFDPDLFDVVESEWTPEGATEPIKCKWCYAKKA